jgi:YVTN family beta-propeller protein
MIVPRRLAACLLSALSVTASPTRAAPPANVAYVTNQGGGVSVVDLGTLTVVRTIQVGRDPRGIGITADGRRLVVANQADADVSIVDTESGTTLKRIGVGKNAEFVRVAPDSRYAYVTYEPSSTGKPPAPAEKSDAKEPSGKGGQGDEAARAEIAVIDLQKLEVTARLPASLETEGMEFSPDGARLVVANEGDDTVVAYDLASGKAVKSIDVTPYGKRPRGVKVSPDGAAYLVTLENSDNFLVLDAQLAVVRAVATGQGPYGVAYQPGGARIWIATARSQQVQVVDAATYATVASVPVGKRCWHFSFTPDGGKVLVACGRSDALSVIDTASLKSDTLAGFKQPWGIVTYPKASGSLDGAIAAK